MTDEEVSLLEEKIESAGKKAEKESDVVVFVHDRPDPDAVGSALCMKNILSEKDVDSVIHYSRESHNYQNQALFTELQLRNELIRTGSIANAETQSGLEDYLKAIKFSIILDTENFERQMLGTYRFIKPDIIIDHHNLNGKIDDALLINKKSGACVSILLEYMQNRKSEFPLEGKENQALRITSYLGIKTDTANFDEKRMTDLDYKAKEFLEDAMTEDDFEKITRIENPKVPRATRVAYGKALAEHDFLGDKLIYYAIPNLISDTALPSYIAERLFAENIGDAVLVMGAADTTEDNQRNLEVVASGRSRDSSIDIIDVFANSFYKIADNGKRVAYSGGRNSVNDITIAGASIPFPDHAEHTKEELSSFWDLHTTKYKKRIMNRLQLS